MKIIPNPNKEEYEEITQMVIDNDGFCPCMVNKNNDTKCVCKVFKEQTTEGMCHCGRFKKIKI